MEAVAAAVGTTVSLRDEDYQQAVLIIALVVTVGFLGVNYQETAKRDARILVLDFGREVMARIGQAVDS